MKLALEALQYDADYDTSVTMQKAAIYALEEALAKQEQPIERNFCERCGKRAFDGIHTCTPPAKQEHGEPDYWLGYGLQAHTEKPFEGATPLYKELK